MTERLQQAIAVAEQLSTEEQDAVAAIMLDEIAAEHRWQELLEDPRSAPLLERLAAEAMSEDAAGHTRDLNELL